MTGAIPPNPKAPKRGPPQAGGAPKKVHPIGTELRGCKEGRGRGTRRKYLKDVPHHEQHMKQRWGMWFTQCTHTANLYTPPGCATSAANYPFSTGHLGQCTGWDSVMPEGDDHRRMAKHGTLFGHSFCGQACKLMWLCTDCRAKEGNGRVVHVLRTVSGDIV